MKQLYLFAVISLSLVLTQSCANKVFFLEESCEELQSINIIDRNGISETIGKSDRLKQYEHVDFLKHQPYQKVMRVYGRDADGNITAVITSYHPNGQPKQYLEVLNNRAFGVYKEWYSNGPLKIEAYVIGGEADIDMTAQKSWLFEGLCNAWDENGRLEAVIAYTKGDLDGPSLHYHPNGQVWKKIPYCKGKIEGVSEVYLDNGEIFQTIEYYNGNKQGISKRYWCEGKTAMVEQYQDGLLLSGQYYDLQGKLVSQIENGAGFRAIFGKSAVNEIHEYRDGIQEGVVKIFDRNGRLTRSYSVRKKLKNGEEIEYFDKISDKGEPLPRLLITWYDGKIQGIVKTWYENGLQESQREMAANQKNGLLSAWYNDGGLMLLEEYDHNVLVRGEYYRKDDKTPVSEISLGNGVATMFDADGNFLRKITYREGKPVE
jgi:antitoxin component YwqK of YwqJK toxin-antitoxin module